MNLENLLNNWRLDNNIEENIAIWKILPAVDGNPVPIPEDIHPNLHMALNELGIQFLYSHQLQAFKLAREGHNLVIATGTASGKSLCYNLPVLDRLLHNSQERALYIFPTKALAQDQAANLKYLIDSLQTCNISNKYPNPQNVNPLNPIEIQTYDGDTPTSKRSAIRNMSRLLISNPEMVHLGILPHHTLWESFFRNLHFIIIDEMHIYRGVFGSHFSNVLRRLKRIAYFYGTHVQFILTSATIANPEELAYHLIEDDVKLIENNGADRGVKNFLVYNPPVINHELGLRRSAISETLRLTEDLILFELQTIIFCRSRRAVEFLLNVLRERMLGALQEISLPEIESENLYEIIRGYRSGYLPKQRRKIEKGLRTGEVRVVISTNALELGIDIGRMEAAVLIGYPGTIASTWQQSGRAGRGRNASLTILVATSDPLDQFFVTHPDYLFDRSPEHGLIDPDNPLILLDHIRCASFELPFMDAQGFGSFSNQELRKYLEFLEQEGILHKSGPHFFWMADQYPAQKVSLRSTSSERVILQSRQGDSSITIGEVDLNSAYWMIHPNAIYLHEGRSYLVEELNLDHKIATMKETSTDYYTEPRRETNIQLMELFAQTIVKGGMKTFGEILVTSQVTGFQKIQWFTQEQLGFGEVSLPPSELITKGYWIELNNQTISKIRHQNLWRNDPLEYGPNWKIMRNQARARDGYICQVCGIKEKEKEHDVHHKTPFRIYKSFEQANVLENLITLCPTCHRKAESVVRVRSGLSGLAYITGHLAPFFVMCDYHDLGVHSDPHSSLAEGNPVVIIYDQVPAGIGLSARLYELHYDLINNAYEQVRDCVCQDGCPSCVGLGGEYGLGGKSETIAILKELTRSQE